MPADLRELFSLEPGQDDALESFIGQWLFEADVWESPRTSDGIVHLRVVECEADRVRLCGRIVEIDQTVHSFWLDLERATTDTDVAWALYFDVIANSPRLERDAIDTCNDAKELTWRVSLAGATAIRGRHDR